eukprot:4607262-Alexandrium_andersonii.AAC.1
MEEVDALRGCIHRAAPPDRQRANRHRRHKGHSWLRGWLWLTLAAGCCVSSSVCGGRTPASGC